VAIFVTIDSPSSIGKNSMAISKTIVSCLLVVFAFLNVDDAVLEATSIVVDEFGDGGWSSGDTRAEGYTDINGGSQLILGRTRTDNPLLLEDTLISPRLNFAIVPAVAPMGPGGARFTTEGTQDKATLDRRDLDSPFDGPLTVEYAWYREADGVPSVAAPALKLIIDTSEANPAGPSAEDKYETVGDKILVYEPYLQAGTIQDGTWETEAINLTGGRFWLVNLTVGGVLPPTNQADLRTLQEWQTEFSGTGESGLITSLQLGVGSGNPSLDSYVDYLAFSNGIENTTWDFEAPIPEPTTLALAALALLGIGYRRRKQV
jgi:hypothetical protein